MVGPGQTEAVTISLRSPLPEAQALLLKSGEDYSRNGVHTLSTVISSENRDKPKALIYNASGENFKVRRGQRISQAISF